MPWRISTIQFLPSLNKLNSRSGHVYSWQKIIVSLKS